MILYQHQPDEAITWRKTPGDEDSDWWAGVQKVGATVALAAALALTGAQTAQAIQVSHLPQDEVIHVAEEDGWQNPVRPAIPANYVARPFLDTDEIVSQPVVPIEDEDFWQQFRPAPGALVWPQQWTFDGAEIVPQPVTPIQDEDYWQNPVVPLQPKLWQPLPYNFDAAELVSTFDEDYWQSFVALPVISYRQPFTEADDFVGYTLDEDYWENQVAPLVQKNAPQPFSDPNDFIGYTLDEDYLLSLVPRFQPVNIWQQTFDGAEIIPQPVAPIQAEDYWQNAVAPVIAKNLYPSPMWDAAEGDQLVVPPAPTGAHYIPVLRRRRR